MASKLQWHQVTRGKRERARTAKALRADATSNAPDEGEEFAKSIRTPRSPTDPKLHHYVPRMLLRGFATDRSRIATIPVAEPRTPRTNSISQTAAIKHFHTTIDTDVGETVAVEKLLGAIEGNAAEVLRRVRQNGAAELSAAERQHLALFVAFQFVRGPGHRRFSEAIADMAFKVQHNLRRNRQPGSPADDEPELGEGVEVALHQNEHIRMMLSTAQELAPLVAQRHIVVARYDPGGLIISDQPVLLYTKKENRNPFLGVGIGTADEIWLPIDRNTVIVFHSDEMVGARDVVVDYADAVRDFNQNMLANAFEEIYCHPDDTAAVMSLEWPAAERAVLTATGLDELRGHTDGVNAAPKRKAPRRYRPPV